MNLGGITENMSEKNNLVRKIYESFGPEIKINKRDKTFEIVNEGIFFNGLTEAYYILKGYKQVNQTCFKHD